MKAIESQEHQGSNYKDAYSEVINKPEHSGRVRMYGKGVTKTSLRKVSTNSSYIFPPEFLHNMQSQVMDQVLQANPQLQKLLEANPEVNIVLPDLSKIGSNTTTPPTESNGQSSVGAHSTNRLVRYFLLPILLPLNLVNRHQFACLDLVELLLEQLIVFMFF